MRGDFVEARAVVRARFEHSFVQVFVVVRILLHDDDVL
jgi:hypothetical protein